MSTYINQSLSSHLSYMDSHYKQPLMELISQLEISIGDLANLDHSLIIEQGTSKKNETLI